MCNPRFESRSNISHTPPYLSFHFGILVVVFRTSTLLDFLHASVSRHVGSPIDRLHAAQGVCSWGFPVFPPVQMFERFLFSFWGHQPRLAALVPEKRRGAPLWKCEVRYTTRGGMTISRLLPCVLTGETCIRSLIVCLGSPEREGVCVTGFGDSRSC